MTEGLTYDSKSLNKKYTYKWRDKNRERYLYYTRILNRRKRAEVRQAILKKFGGKCVKCGFDDPRALQVDHINGGGQKEFKDLGVRRYYKNILEDKEGRYQLLCANCNAIKRIEEKEIKRYDD